jgi:hypothetical protein
MLGSTMHVGRCEYEGRGRRNQALSVSARRGREESDITTTVGGTAPDKLMICRMSKWGRYVIYRVGVWLSPWRVHLCSTSVLEWATVGMKTPNQIRYCTEYGK